MDIKNLLEVRKNTKKRKPNFARQDAHKKVRVKDSWRKPKGWNSKMRQGLRGYRKCVTPGYKSPLAVRGLTRQGLEMVRVSRKEDLSGLFPDKHILIISSGMGTRKKIEVLKEAVAKGFGVLNYKDAAAHLEKINEALEKKKKDKQKEKEIKEEKEKEKEEAVRKKEEEEKKQLEEEKKQQGEEKSTSKEEPTKEEPKDEKSLDDIAKDEEEKKKQEEKKEKDKVLTKKS